MWASPAAGKSCASSCASYGLCPGQEFEIASSQIF